MPSIIVQGELDEALKLDGFSVYMLYNALDSAVTAQLFPVMATHFNDNTLTVYDREMRLQSLCLEMSREGFPVSKAALLDHLYYLENRAAKALRILHRFCEAIGTIPVNPGSPTQVAALFYDYLRFPAITTYNRAKKTENVSTDIKALEKLRDNYTLAGPFVNAILAYRENAKLASVFRRGLEPDTGNLRCNFTPSGTETGRLSSQQNPYERGTNAQNITNVTRQVVCAPEGYCILNYDKKTAESIAVGFISGCVEYINACLGGDLHTSVAKLVWPALDWSGNLKNDKLVAESPFYRMFSYRDMAKRGGHGTNYYGTPRTMAMHLKVETKLIADFQDTYFARFPEIAEWHLRVISQIQRFGTITTALRRERRFWGRPDDAETHRSAIAFDPQSLVADEMNESLMATQAWLLKECRDARTYIGSAKNKALYPLRANLRAQVHDAGVFILPVDAVAELAPAIQQRLIHPVDFGPLGVMEIPTDCQIGRTWCKVPKKARTKWELAGLRDYTSGDDISWLSGDY